MVENASYDNQFLLSQLAQSDEQAFMTLYQRYWQKIFTIANNRLENSQEAEDIVHDVFISLWQNRHTQQIQQLENYLAVATKYIVLGRIKSKLRERKYRESVDTAMVVEMPVESSLHYKRILLKVKTEVEKLPEKCRIIFQYSRNEGMSVKQIAKVMHISPKTVENQLNKALRHLRTAVRTFLPLLLMVLTHI
nr:RNA polymerase sigma-70 factor [uncultured Sediminibacterium sp.]